MSPEDKARLHQAKINQALFSLGETLADVATLLQQGWRDDNGALRGNIAAGFERTAAYLRGEPYDPAVHPKHENIRKGT